MAVRGEAERHRFGTQSRPSSGSSSVWLRVAGSSALPQGKCREDEAQGARRAQRVSGHGLGRGDRNRRQTRAEHRVQGLRLVAVVQHRAGAVGLHIVDPVRRHAAVVERRSHGAGGAIGIGGGDVGGVGTHSESDKLAMDPGAARPGPVHVLQHQPPQRLRPSQGRCGSSRTAGKCPSRRRAARPSCA